MKPLHTTTHDTPAGPVIRIGGVLDYDTAPELRSRLSALVLRSGDRLVLDLTALEFCDSSGIAAFLAARNHAQAAGADVGLDAVPEKTLRLLRVMGLDEVFGASARRPGSPREA
ncbi:STAS domain-containing protein [Streptomyces sp. WG-D5]